MRHAAKTDVNHAEIRDTLRAIPGMKLLDTSGMAGLGCDLLASWQGGPPPNNWTLRVTMLIG